MAGGSHFVEECECGVILAQCRCDGPKIVRVVKPCIHGEQLSLLS